MALARIPAREPLGPGGIAAFAASISGTVIRPDDPAFDAARQVHNTIYDR